MKKQILDKTTRTSLMYGVIIILVVGIVVCILRISVRPKVDKPEEFSFTVKEEVSIEEVEVAKEEKKVNIEVHDRARILEDNINVRSGPGTDYERVGTAYQGFDFEIMENDGSDWIKIKYDDKPAYIYAEFVEVVPMFLNDMGEYEEYVDIDNSAADSNKSPDEASNTDETIEEDTTSEN